MVRVIVVAAGALSDGAASHGAVAAAADGALAAAAEALRAGGLVAFPTETVYGLGANALDPAAVARIFAAKGRPADNPVIVHAPDAETAWRVTSGPTPLAERLAERFWPGPLTLVLPAAPGLPRAATAGLPSVAVRVPDHPVALALLRAAGVPVAAPSANRSGRPSPTTAAHVLADLGDAVDVVVDGGPCAVGLESTVVDARGDEPIVLREGAITREMLFAVVGGGVAGTVSLPELAASPGTRHRHYAPSCRVVIAAPSAGPAVAATLARGTAAGAGGAGSAGGAAGARQAVGTAGHARAAGSGARLAAGRATEGERRVGLVAVGPAPDGVVEVARFTDAAELAARLYEALRAAEAAGVTDLVVESVPESGIGRAVMDRLRRAAEGSGA